MQHDIFGSGHDLYLRSTFQHDLSRSNLYHSTRLDKRNTMQATEMLCLYWVKSYYRKLFFCKNGYFWSFCSMEAKSLIINQYQYQSIRSISIWGHISERTLKELSNALLRSTVALLVPELRASLSKNVEIDQILPLVTSGDLAFDLT